MREEILNMKFKLYCLLVDGENTNNITDSEYKMLNLLGKDKDIIALQKNERNDFEEKLMFY